MGQVIVIAQEVLTVKKKIKTFLHPEYKQTIDRVIGVIIEDDGQGQNADVDSAYLQLLQTRAGKCKTEDEAKKTPEYQIKMLNSANRQFDAFGEYSEYVSLGAGFPLYFSFTSSAQSLLLTLSIFAFGLSLHYHSGSGCDTEDWCQNAPWTINYSIANRLNEYDSYSFVSWLNLAFFLVLWLMLILWRRNFRKEALTFLKEQPPIYSDLAVLISHLPNKLCEKGEKQEDAIKEWIEGLGEGYTVEAVTLAFDTRKISALRKQYTSMKFSTLRTPKFLSKFEEVKKELKDLETAYDNNTTDTFIGKAFVVFSNTVMAERFFAQAGGNFPVYKKFLTTYCGFSSPLKFSNEGNSSFIFAERPDEPEGVLWENLTSTQLKRIMVQTLRFFLCLLLCIFAYLIANVTVYGLKFILEESITKNFTYISYQIQGFPVIYSIILVGSCLTMESMIIKWATNTNHHSFSALEIDVSESCGTFSFVITGLLTPAVTLYEHQYFSDLGLVDLTFTVVCTFAAFMLLKTIFDTKYLKHLESAESIRKRKSVIRKYTQEAFNEQFYKLPHFEMGKFQGNKLAFLYLSCFFFSIVPFATVVCYVGVLACTFAERYHFCKRCSLFCLLRPDIPCSVAPKMKWLLIFFTLGSVLRDFMAMQIGITDATPLSIPNYIMAGISVFYWLFPSECIVNLNTFNLSEIFEGATESDATTFGEMKEREVKVTIPIQVEIIFQLKPFKRRNRLTKNPTQPT